jgi:SAM-dependent methyltransferase
MTARVLRNRDEIEAARKALRERGASALRGGAFWRWASQHVPRIGGIRPWVGDQLKSWDVLLTVDELQREIGTDERVLDLGCYASEILPALRQLGFRLLAGMDLQRGVRRMPYGREIHYLRGNFLRTPFPERSVTAVTAISVIEHGYDGDALFSEVSRVLRPGGLFVASTDYWPEKIDTSTQRLFGMEWRIFSRRELGEMFALAQQHGLRLVGAVDIDVIEPVIHWGGRDYTFAWFVLRKS